MELTGKRFCMVSDKEQLLHILNLNNVPALKLVDPKTCSYPIIGRKFGHHGGKDLKILHTKDKALDEDFDYFTKLYAFEQEFCLEIEGLQVKSMAVAKGEQVIFNEVPIRTDSFGWIWQPLEDDQLASDWKDIAVRALYVTGLSAGLVKVGVLPNETILIVDINSVNIPYKKPPRQPAIPFTMGADIEFMLSCSNELVPASTFFPLEGKIGCDDRQIEQDSGEYALAELRPEKAETVQGLFDHIKKLLEEASEIVPFQNIEFRAGSMPFWGYQCGGHLHFGLPHSLTLLRALDHFLAVPMALIEESRTAKLRRKTKHGGLGRYRVKPYGFEYLSLSSWIIEPRMALAILSLARLVATHHHELESQFLFNPIAQRAYYQGNKIILKQFWEAIKSRLKKTASYPIYEKELSYLIETIDNEVPVRESSDIRRNWGITPGDQTYDRGLVILIPKKTRHKHELKQGLTTYIRAGNRISKATIKPYPFSFRNPNIVQLSETLREKLALPKAWNPRVSADNGVLSLGPIIGILANRPFDRQTTYFEHLGRIAADKQMLIYVFEPKDIDWDKEMIKGVSLTGEGIFPFPAVIYDRMITVSKNKHSFDEVRVKLQTIHQIPFINPINVSQLTSNKWDTHQLLEKNYKEYLPDARLLNTVDDVKEMLDYYGEIFLKPLGGTMSKGVIRVIRRPAGIFLLNIKEKEIHSFANLGDLYSFMTPLFQKQPYLIQEGIRRKQYRGKNVEIRVYMQKNGRQKWFRTGMVTRLTNEDVLTEETETNMRISKVLEYLYQDPTERKSITNQLGKISRNIVVTIEKEVGPFGEMAVDLCIDQYNAIRLLEVNSKPDNLFSQIGAYRLRNVAGNRLLNYAASLAGYEGDE